MGKMDHWKIIYSRRMYSYMEIYVPIYIFIFVILVKFNRDRLYADILFLVFRIFSIELPTNVGVGP